jgi:hypothetical protein
MRYSPVFSAFAVAAVVGCASSSSDISDGAAAPQATRIVGVKSEIEMRTNPTVSRASVLVDASLADTWKKLSTVYDSIGIPVTSSDPGQGVLGNDNFKIRRRLKDVPLTRYLDCGSTQGGPSAETYDIIMIVKTYLQPSAGGTMATTFLQASGRPVSLSGNFVNCASTGRLEARIGELLGGSRPPA